MAKIEFIGNLGADARVEEMNGRKFVAFNVADTQKFKDADGNEKEKTDWISCTMNGDGGGLLPYLKKGKSVFIRGFMSTRIFNSPKNHCMMAGVNCAVRELELVGGSVRDIPRQLYDSKGVLYDVSMLYFVDSRQCPANTILYDMSGNQYVVDAYGRLTKDTPDQQENTKEGNSQYNGEQAKVF